MELVFGRQEKLEALTLNHGDDVEELTRQVKEKAKELDDGDGGLVLVDLLGGSPCNVTASPPFAFTILTYFIAKGLWNLGYKIGKESVKSILDAGWIKDLISGTSILGLFMMGALSVQYVSLSTPISFNIAGSKIAIQTILDSIAPGLLPLGIVFGIYFD